jgi:hypothetical protein
VLSFVPVRGVRPKDPAHRHKGEHENCEDFRSRTLTLSLTLALAPTLALSLTLSLTLALALAQTLARTLSLPLSLPLALPPPLPLRRLRELFEPGGVFEPLLAERAQDTGGLDRIDVVVDQVVEARVLRGNRDPHRFDR